MSGGVIVGRGFAVHLMSLERAAFSLTRVLRGRGNLRWGLKALRISLIASQTASRVKQPPYRPEELVVGRQVDRLVEFEIGLHPESVVGAGGDHGVERRADARMVAGAGKLRRDRR